MALKLWEKPDSDSLAALHCRRCHRDYWTEPGASNTCPYCEWDPNTPVLDRNSDNGPCEHCADHDGMAPWVICGADHSTDEFECAGAAPHTNLDGD